VERVVIRSQEALAVGVTCNRWRHSQLDTCCSGGKLKCGDNKIGIFVLWRIS